MFKKKPSPTFEEIAGDIEKWLSSNDTEDTTSLKMYLAIISARYLDTKNTINYLKANLKNPDFKERIETIDENLQVILNAYQLILCKKELRANFITSCKHRL